MKKILALLVFVMTLSLIGCNKAEEALPLNLTLTPVVLNDSVRGFEITINSNLTTYNNQTILRFGILYGLNTNIDLNKESSIEYTELILSEAGTYTFTFSSVDESYYSESLIISPYIIYGEDEIVFAINKTAFSMYNLAKSDPSSFAKRIVAFVEGKIVSTVSLSVDTKKYTATTNDLGYTVDLYTDYNIIRLTVTLKVSYLFDDTVSLIINDKTISPLKWTKGETSVMYVFDDPNWTGPY